VGYLQIISFFQYCWWDTYKLFPLSNFVGGMPTNYFPSPTLLVGCLQIIWNFQLCWWNAYKLFGTFYFVGGMPTNYLELSTLLVGYIQKFGNFQYCWRDSRTLFGFFDNNVEGHKNYFLYSLCGGKGEGLFFPVQQHYA
jgi:hypothetical protein